MYITRSLQASAFFLSFSTLTAAVALHRTADSDVQLEARTAHSGSLDSIFKKRQDAQELECPNDRWQAMLDSNPADRVATFCNEWLGLEPATTVVEWTPTMSVYSSSILSELALTILAASSPPVHILPLSPPPSHV